MSLNKKILAVAILGGLSVGTAQAAVDISADPVVPAVIAAEATVDAANGLDIVNNTNALDLDTTLGYSFSSGEVRHVRVECSDNMVFTSGAVAYVPTALGAATIGAINGIGTNAIHFSITATNGTVVAGDTISVDGNRNVDAMTNVSCTYGLYDTPSQAAQGGTAGRITGTSGAYLTFANSYGLAIDAANTNVADVEASPAFADYTVTTNGISDLAAIGDYHFDLNGAFTGGTTPLNPATGSAIALGDILGADTALVFGGDFSAAVDADGDFDPTKVFISSASDCSGAVADADEVTATSATFVIGAAASDNTLCYQSAGDVAIPVSDYTVSLDASATGTAFAAPDLAAANLGSIVHNGTELQAPLAQLPGSGWLSRMVLTNTGGVDRPYTIEVIGEDGNTISTENLTGTVLADSVLVIDLKDVMIDSTEKLRGTLNVTVAGPNEQIQGMFQIVNSESGSISNHVMVRPGTN